MGIGSRFCFIAVLSAINVYAETNFTCPEPDGQFPDGANCRNYYLCWKNEATAEECPNNMLFDVNQAICTLLEDVNCASRQDPNKIEILYTCTQDFGLFPNDEDDKTYYYCNNGVPAFMTCPCGTTFNVDENNKCVEDVTNEEEYY